MDTAVWSQPFTVRAYEVDPEGRASIQSICNYLQETAGIHATRLGAGVEQLMEQRLTWFLSRLHVQLDDYPTWRNELRVETWPSGISGLLATRDFLLFDGDRPLGRATSAWLLIDIERRRPIRPPAFLTSLKRPARPPALPHVFDKIRGPSHTDGGSRFRVRYSDLDVNRHVNNVRYVEWAVESVPKEVLERSALESIDISFSSETNFGDLVIGQVERVEGEEIAFAHRLYRTSDGREVAVARSTWR